jgi:hypothetical protein
LKVEKPVRFLIYQAMLLPFLWLIPIIIGFMIPDYDSISQHISEIAINESIPVMLASINQISSLAIDVSITLFAIGLVFYEKKGISFTVFIGLVYGVGMLSNSIFPMGSPLHGLYGLPMFSVIIPAIFALEYGNGLNSKVFIKCSIVITILNFIYLWASVVGLDPNEYRGLTQRIAIYVINIWYFFAAYVMYKEANKVIKSHS